MPMTADIAGAKKTKPMLVWPSIFACTFAFALIIPNLWWQGYVIQKLWHWFIPQPVPTIYMIVGALIVLRAALPRPVAYKDHKYVAALANTVLSFLWPLGFLIVGSMWHWAQWGT